MLGLIYDLNNIYPACVVTKVCHVTGIIIGPGHRKGADYVMELLNNLLVTTLGPTFTKESMKQLADVLMYLFNIRKGVEEDVTGKDWDHLFKTSAIIIISPYTCVYYIPTLASSLYILNLFPLRKRCDIFPQATGISDVF